MPELQALYNRKSDTRVKQKSLGEKAIRVLDANLGRRSRQPFLDGKLAILRPSKPRAGSHSDPKLARKSKSQPSTGRRLPPMQPPVRTSTVRPGYHATTRCDTNFYTGLHTSGATDAGSGNQEIGAFATDRILEQLTDCCTLISLTKCTAQP